MQVMKIKKSHVYIAIAVLLLFLIGFYVSKQNYNTLSNDIPRPSISPSAESLPISLKQKNVLNTTAFYTFIGQVSKLTDTTIEIKSDDTTTLPNFSILDTTDYYELVDTQPQKTDKSRITVSSNVDLTANYNFKTKLWTLNRITLLPPPPSITP